MYSVVPGFEYDIFISYRHKDNKYDGWVTDFVSNLKRELDSVFKEDISIYYDSNPKDGILETYNVDKSVELKIRSLILIPVLSQTYCDPSSFAWQYEFITFNQMALHDQFGREIKLRNGNIASRVLPIAIHDIDQEDKNLIETELKSKLRFIDFIFRSPGVNRPLRLDDRREDSINGLLYRDQINKVANAIKEIIYGIKYPDRTLESRYPDAGEGSSGTSLILEQDERTEKELREKSVAVLPFVSLAQDSSQEYFADGITENILTQLAGLHQLRVISRTSVMRYKKTTKSAPEIALELGVKYILEGSAQSQGNKVRINVQLIDAQKDRHLWSKVFVESLDDIFAIQSNVAEVVANELQSSMNFHENEKLREIPTKNFEAYDLFLKGRHAFNQWSVEGYRTAADYFKRALEKDPEFKLAYSYLASAYSARMSWNGDLSPQEALIHIDKYLDEAWKRGATDNDYLTKAFVEFFIYKNFSASESLLLKAIHLSPNHATVMYTYSYLLCMMGRFEEGLRMVEKAMAIEPHSVAYYNYEGISLYLLGRYDEAVVVFGESLKLFPSVIRFFDHLGRVYLTMGKFEDAITTLTSGLNFSKLRPPSMVAYLAASYYGEKKHAQATELLEELIRRSNNFEKGVNIYVVHVFCALGDLTSAERWLNNARRTNDIDLIWFEVDPLLRNLREFISGKNDSPSLPDFQGVEKFIIQKLKKELPQLQYHNIDHVLDVLKSCEHIAVQEKVGERDIQLLRLGALFHDLGLIEDSKMHEERSARFAREILPGFGFNEEDISLVCNMILATKIPQMPVSQLDKILCDADLDYLGREDFYEVGSRLYDELKSQGVVENEREWNLIQKTFLESHRYHTAYSKSHREKFKQERLKEIAEKLKRKG